MVGISTKIHIPLIPEPVGIDNEPDNEVKFMAQHTDMDMPNVEGLHKAAVSGCSLDHPPSYRSIVTISSSSSQHFFVIDATEDIGTSKDCGPVVMKHDSLLVSVFWASLGLLICTEARESMTHNGMETLSSTTDCSPRKCCSLTVPCFETLYFTLIDACVCLAVIMW